MVVGEIAMLIPVVGSVHEEDEVVVEVAEVVVVHVMAVLVVGAYFLHETRLNNPISNAKIERRLTAPLSLTSHMPIHCGSVATALQKNANYDSSCLAESSLPFHSFPWNGWQH